MQVILLDKVANLGNLGDVVKVKNGFARNYLIPTKRARRATEAAIKEFEGRRADLEKLAADKLAAAQATGESLAGKTVKLSQKAGVDGRPLRFRAKFGDRRSVEDPPHHRCAFCHRALRQAKPR